MRCKPLFKAEIKRNELGSLSNKLLLHALKPRLWFLVHLHTKFEATVTHRQRTNTENETNTEDPDEIDLDEDDDAGAQELAAASAPADTRHTEFLGMESNDGACSAESNVESLTAQMTRFLSLDKCLPQRRHLQIAHVEASASPCRAPPARDSAAAWLDNDAPWLAILRRTHEWTQQTRRWVVLPESLPITDAKLTQAREVLEQRMKIPRNFARTAAPFDTSSDPHRTYGPPQGMVGNPQTDAFLKALGLEHRITVLFDMPPHPSLFSFKL